MIEAWRDRSVPASAKIPLENPRQASIPRRLPSGIASVVVKVGYRNAGACWGDPFPFIYGEIEGAWCIWHRLTGEVRYVSPREGRLGESDVWKTSEPSGYNDGGSFGLDEVA